MPRLRKIKDVKMEDVSDDEHLSRGVQHVARRLLITSVNGRARSLLDRL